MVELNIGYELQYNRFILIMLSFIFLEGFIIKKNGNNN